MHDVYFVHMINNFQASYSCISAKVLHAARDRMVRTPRWCPGYAVKRKLVMVAPWCIHLQQVKDSPMRSTMKVRMTMFVPTSSSLKEMLRSGPRLLLL